MKRKCLVIGGNGFIGKNLVFQLLQEQYTVYVYDVATNGIRESLSHHDNLVLIEGDVNNTPYLSSFIDAVETVFWLIHTTVPATSMYDVEFDLLSNLPPLIRFIDQMKQSTSIKTFVYISSGGTIYGQPKQPLPIEESALKNPISSYGLTKMIAEDYITFLLKDATINTFILRPSNVYGKYQNLLKPQGLIGHLFKSIITTEPIVIFGDGTITRDYLHVNDLTDAMIACMNIAIDESPLVLNIASGIGITINEMINEVSKISASNVPIVNKPIRKFDCNYNVLSIQKAQRMLNWSPKVNINDGLRDMWNWMTENSK